MLDGFDEIKSEIQTNVIQLLMATTKIERLFVTTRPYLKKKTCGA